jgi:hypothetical protein
MKSKDKKQQQDQRRDENGIRVFLRIRPSSKSSSSSPRFVSRDDFDENRVLFNKTSLWTTRGRNRGLNSMVYWVTNRRRRRCLRLLDYRRWRMPWMGSIRLFLLSEFLSVPPSLVVTVVDVWCVLSFLRGWQWDVAFSFWFRFWQMDERCVFGCCSYVSSAHNFQKYCTTKTATISWQKNTARIRDSKTYKRYQC